MIDKWDIYRHNNQILFARSWSQFAAYRIHFRTLASVPMPEDALKEMSEELLGDKLCISSFKIEKITKTRKKIKDK